MSQAMTPQPAGAGIETVRSLFTQLKPQLQMALPRHMKPDRLIRVALTSCQKNPTLLECDKITLAGAVVQCAQLGLEPDDGTGKAYLVPFRNSKKNRLEVQFIPGYRGLIDLARRSGQISSIEARAVHEKDAFRYSFGLVPILEHKPSTEKDPGKLIYVYAVARFKDGSVQFDVMTLAEVEKIRARSKAKDSGPWVTDYEEMAKKTVVRRLSKLLPSSTEFQRAVSLDERAELGLPQDLGVLVDENEKGTPVDTEAQTEPVEMPDEVREPVAEQPAAAVAGDEPPAAPAAPAGMEDRIAKFDGKCAMGCGQPVKKGTKIKYDRAAGAVFHAECLG